jgi:carbamoyltransferase
MKILLGIQEAHDASAALMIDGGIVAAAQEERFTGLKGDYGFPKLSIQACLASAGIKATQIDEVLLASHNWNPVLTKIKRNANFSVDDWVKEQRDFWKPTLLEGKKVRYYDLYKDREDFAYDDTYPMDHMLDGYMDAGEMADMASLRVKTVSTLLGIPLEKIRTVTHEDCHTFYAYFASQFRGQVLALTAEGIGDYSNGTVSIFSEEGRRELAATRDNHIGHIYQYITLLLGMKPAQHEYKVMGLAPYANAKELEKSYQVFAPVLKVDGLKIVFDQKPQDLYFHFRDRLEGHRFDGIAGALQKFTETLLSTWAKNCIAESGLPRVCLSGGVAQNIKAGKSLMEIPELEDIFICPAAGDTSLPLGACYFGMWQHLRAHKLPLETLKPLDNIYLGPEFSDDEISECLATHRVDSTYRVSKGVSPEVIARKLADGKIIARCCGRMEFGLRALGNRSILADPRRPETVRLINDAIKFRDFWMPFTPTILAERESDYIVNPKGVSSPYMTMAFDSTERAQRELIAALHPADLTARPQVLEERRNPEYFAIIKAFERLTGVGGVLNTSFNLHGDPIVLGPRQALSTFENSAIDALILGDWLIER